MIKNRPTFYADELSGSKLTIDFSTTLRNVVNSQTASVKVLKNIAQTFLDGTITDKCDKVWFSENRALVGGTNEELDLYDLGSVDIGAGAGKDPLGGTLALAEIVTILVYVESTSVGTLEIGGTSSATGNEFNSIFGADAHNVKGLKAKSVFLIHNPADPAFAVADTTNHKLKMAAVGGAVDYSIYIFGRSA
jgi:hypothetical protein